MDRKQKYKNREKVDKKLSNYWKKQWYKYVNK